MRWQKPKIGDQRRIKVFLFLPICLDGEWRWLEQAEIIQEYVRRYYRPFGGGDAYVEYWKDMHWCNYLMTPLSS